MEEVHIYKNWFHMQSITYTFGLNTWHNLQKSYIPKFATQGGHTFFINIASADMKHYRSHFFPDITKPGFGKTCFEFSYT